MALETTPKTAAADRLKSETLRWQAKVCDPGAYGDKVGVDFRGNIGLEWAAALEAALSERDVLAAEIIEGDDDAPGAVVARIGR